MTLRECYIEHSYYYPRLEWEMSQIAEKNGLNGLRAKAIEAFCSGKIGDLKLDNTEDYKNILDEFQCFVSGVVWALKDALSEGQQV